MLNDKDKNFISILIYTDNNYSNLNSFIFKLSKKLYQTFSEYEIIIVNNQLSSSNIQILELITEINSDVSVIHLIKKYDRDSAMNYCIDKCIGDYIFVLDKFNDSYDFIETCINNYKDMVGKYDLVLISYKNNSFLKIILNLTVKFYAGLEYFFKPVAGVILTRKALNRIRSVYKVSIYRNAEYLTSGLKTKEVIIDESFNDKLNLHKISFGIDTLLLYTDAFFKVGTYLIFIFFFTTLASLIYTAYFYISTKTIQGWATIMSFISISFLGVFITLYLFLRYLNLILKNTINKNSVIVDKIERLQKISKR